MREAMTVTRQQAERELARLCEALDRPIETLRDGQVAVWLDMLEDLPYEAGRAAVTHVIRTWRGTRFPPPGVLTEAVEAVREEGIPAAGAYSQEPPRTTMTLEQVRKAIEQMDRWVAMSDDEYMAELERIRERMERRQALKVVGGR